MSLESYRAQAAADGIKKQLLYAISSDGDYLRVQRLNFQHNSITNILDKKLIFAPVAFTEGDHILDCGTGTGIWANDVAKVVPPGVIIEGADISQRFFPSSGENSAVTFHNLSTFDLPTEWENRFKLVNQRLMIACFSRPQWESALQEIHRVLNPEGWVQLVEIQQKHNFSATHPKYQKLLDVLHPMMRVRGFIFDSGSEIEKMMQQGGFKNITRRQRAAPVGEWGGDRGPWIWFRGAFRGMKDAVLQVGVVESSEEFDRILEEAFEECNEIPGLAHDVEVIR